MLTNLLVTPTALLCLLVACGAAAAGDKEKLEGRWDVPGSALGSFLRLRADGTFKLDQGPLVMNLEGKYRLLGNGIIELDYPGILWGRWVEERKYRFLDDDTLEWNGIKLRRTK